MKFKTGDKVVYTGFLKGGYSFDGAIGNIVTATGDTEYFVDFPDVDSSPGPWLCYEGELTWYKD